MENLTKEQKLRKSVLNCLLFKDTFYENGISIAERINSLVPQVSPEIVASLAIEAREKFHLRHAPLWLIRSMAKTPTHKYLVSSTLERVISRADELAYFLYLYWMDGKCPISSQVKKGLAKAFTKFDAYNLAKYKKEKNIFLRDVMFLTHPKPKDEKQAEIWKKLANNVLEKPDTWEVNLSAGADKKETFERLIIEKKLGALAFLKNLNGMIAANVDKKFIEYGFETINFEQVLPFRFITAKNVVKEYHDLLEKAMLNCLKDKERLTGKTVLLVDVSGSMFGYLKKDILCIDFATGIAVLLRELCENVQIYTFSNLLKKVEPVRGFALEENIKNSQPNLSTYMARAIKNLNSAEKTYDRLIIITDEQAQDSRNMPSALNKKSYICNIASYKESVDNKKGYVRVDGFSEAIIDYIINLEKEKENGWKTNIDDMVISIKESINAFSFI